MKEFAVASSLFLGLIDFLVAFVCFNQLRINAAWHPFAGGGRTIYFLGNFFIAGHFLHLGIDRANAALSYYTGMWPAVNATPFWYTSNFLGAAFCLGVLWWGLAEHHSRLRADGVMEATRQTFHIGLLCLAVSMVVFFLDWTII